MVADRTPTALDAEDARILALERGPIRGHTLKVLVVDDAPEQPPVDELCAAVSRGLVSLPRWTQRLVRVPGTETGWAWQEDPDFDIRHHVRLLPTEHPVDEPELAGLVAGIMTAPLDRGRPLWTLDVVPRTADGRWVLVWKVHHCLADGMAMMQAASHLLWTAEDPHGNGRAPGPAVAGRGTRPGATAQAAAGARLARVAGYRGLFLREFRRVRSLSPLAGQVGPDRAVAFAQCGLAELRTIGKAVSPQATVNDVLLAVVAGALRAWLGERASSASALKVQVPVSMHPQRAADGASGNADSFLFVSLPVGEADPVERVRSVSRATRLRKNRHDARAIYALRESLSRAPARLRRLLQRVVQGPHEYSLNVSNVPGPAGPVSVLGRHVHALYSFAEVSPHHGLRVAAVSLEGTLSIGLCADPTVVPGLDVLAAGIRSALDELHGRLGTSP